MPITRKTGDATKKVVAARQQWCCGSCSTLLPSSFEVDHTIPLWQGGLDDASNLKALCPNCHASKTQLEAIQRAEKRRQLADRARHEHELKTRSKVTKEVRSDAIRLLGNGRQRCRLCGRKTLSMFPHVCGQLQFQINQRLGLKNRADAGFELNAHNPFLRFSCG